MHDVKASFRDPSGRVFSHEGIIYRRVEPRYAAALERMQKSGFLEVAFSRGLLVPHEEVPPGTLPETESAHAVLKPEKIDFISYPYEWSFGQLKDAALHTLAVQRCALDHELILKDASAYNVQFHRGRPVLIDTLSFDIYQPNRPWVAYRQFCRHFLAPLALMSRRSVELNKLFRVYIDGVPLDLASALLPWTSYLKPALLTHVHLHARTEKAYAKPSSSESTIMKIGVSKQGLYGLMDGLESAIRSLDWAPQGTEWIDYYDHTNYPDEASEHKKRLVGEMISEISPRTAWDLGANTGAYSRLASDNAVQTVAFDSDPAAIEASYRLVKERKETHLLPLVMDLTNPSPALGWAAEERDSLSQRGKPDLILALALIHHLAIGNNVPLDRIAQWLSTLTKHLIIELVPKSDSQVVHMLSSREDIFEDYDREGFESAFGQFFELKRSEPIAGTERRLYSYQSSSG